MKMIRGISTKKWLPWLTTVSLAIVLIVVHVRLYQYAYDDAYIHFRVARNLFETGKPYFNVNDMLKVSTSSGWIVFLTLLYGVANVFKVGNYFPLIVSISNALILLCGLKVYTKIIENLLNNQLSISKKLLFQISFLALLIPSSIGLMETPLALLIAGLGIYIILRSKPSGFALIGLAVYFRLELIVLLALAGVFVIFKKQFRLYQVICYSFLFTSFLVIFDLHFYQTVVPHSIIAKSKVYSLSVFETLFHLFDSFPSTLHIFSLYYFGIITIIFLSTIIIVSWLAFRERNILKSFWPFLFCLVSLGIMSGYLLGNALIFDWYTPLYLLPLFLACFVCSFMIGYPRNLVIKIPVFGLFLVSFVSLISIGYASIFNPRDFVLFEQGSRVKTYLFIGKILNEEYPNATLLSSEIGGLGYSF